MPALQDWTKGLGLNREWTANLFGPVDLVPEFVPVEFIFVEFIFVKFIPVETVNAAIDRR
jgi:hypothetical protein